MKNIYCIITFLIFSVVAKGQHFEAGVIAATSLDGFCQVDAGFEASFRICVVPRLDVGVGVGLQFSRPAYMERIPYSEDGVKVFLSEFHSKYHLSSYIAPVFGRIRYALSPAIFAQTDIGYRFPIYVDYRYWAGGIPDFDKNIRGVYFEPQVGALLTKHQAVTVGFILQRMATRQIININSFAGLCSFERRPTAWHPSVVVKYCFVF